MGMAMVATFYGVLLANLVFTPLSGRLEFLSEEEATLKEMMLVGIMAIAHDDAPLIVREKMLIYLSKRERKRYDRKTQKKGKYRGHILYILQRHDVAANGIFCIVVFDVYLGNGEI